MARSIGSTVENNFVNGHVTEATALNFPESASASTYNCVFHVKGNVSRRKGIDFEELYVAHSMDRSDKASNTYYWKSAGGSGLFNFIVVQSGTDLLFFGTDDGNISKNYKATLSLLPFIVPGSSEVQTYEVQFTSGKGFLFVAHPYMDTVYIEYNSDTSSFLISSIDISVRDFDGVEDYMASDTRLTQGTTPPQLTLDGYLGKMSKEHQYNLCNQGWHTISTGGLSDVDIAKAGQNGNYPPGYDVANPLNTWINSRNDLPADSDVWWLYKDAFEIMQPKLANANTRGNSPAPKGHYILKAFYEDRSAISGIPGFTAVTPGFNRPSTVAFFAGRVFYSGVNANKYSNKIYFSQVVKKTGEFYKCFQENDPTSETIFSLLATDGGVIQILDAGNIIKLVAIQNSLVVFATNGVWTITGSTGTGFTASDYSVNRISAAPVLSANSFVDVGGMPVWWTQDGIYAVTASNNALGQITIQSLTEKKNKTYFNEEIPLVNKKYARGCYNPVSKVIQWLFRKDTVNSVAERYDFDSVLCFNTISQAFYNWTLPNQDCKISGIVAIEGAGSSSGLEAVSDTAGAVVTASGATVTTTARTNLQLSANFKYLTNYPIAGVNKITFSEERDDNHLDFYSYDLTGTDSPAYFVSGFKVHGDAQKKWQSNYVFIFCDNTLTNKFYFQSVWDYHNDATSGEFGTKQLVGTGTAVPYKAYTFNRLKIRGMGVSLQFKISSLPGENFNLVGWSAFESANARV